MTRMRKYAILSSMVRRIDAELVQLSIITEKDSIRVICLYVNYLIGKSDNWVVNGDC